MNSRHSAETLVGLFQKLVAALHQPDQSLDAKLQLRVGLTGSLQVAAGAVHHAIESDERAQ